MVIERARAVGAQALVAIGETPDRADAARTIALRYPGFVFFTCGMHPHEASSWQADHDSLRIREALAAGAVAVGECGLDYHYDNSPRDMQKRVLYEQLDIAATTGAPLVIHTRDAEPDTMEFLSEAAGKSVIGVLHCYTGSQELAAWALDRGWYVSFSGIITFRKWTDTALLRMVPEDRLLVESDAPYLAPVPMRGKRNESSFVPHTIAKLAQLREVSAEHLARQTLRNTEQLFGFSVSHSVPPQP